MTFLASVHSQLDQVTPQIIQEILKSYDVVLEKIECYSGHAYQEPDSLHY